MRNAALFYLVGVCFLCGCVHNIAAEVSKRELPAGIPGPFFDYDQNTPSEPRHINLGNIPLDVNKITAAIPFSNPGREPLIIEKVDGPCACFTSWNGDKQIAPGQKSVINAFFNKNKIESGPVTRFVRIKTNDPANNEVKIFFDFNVIRSPEQEDIHFLQNEVQSLKNELQALRKEITKNAGDNRKAAGEEKPDTTIYDVAIGSSPVLGPNTAPVTIVEFFDFQCPYCVKEYSKLKQVLSEYPGKVRLVLKNYPLDFHKQSFAAHAVAQFALRQKGQDAYWKLCDTIMAEPKKLEPAVLRTYAQTIGLDTNGLDKLWADEKAISELLKPDKELAIKCKVRGTPTVLINGLTLADRSLEGYRSRINQILSLEGKSSVQQAKQDIKNDSPSAIKHLPVGKDLLEVTSCKPSDNAVLALGENFNVEVLYELNTLDSAVIWVRPFTNGDKTPDYKAHHMVLVDGTKEKSGIVTGWFSFDKPADVDEIRVYMGTPNSEEVVKEISYKISAKWE
jgi:protein-disulfide isomerase